MESLSFRLSIVALFLILNLGLLQADFTEVVELRRKLGSGSCSKSRFGEVMQEIITCQAQGQKLRTVMNICLNKENALKCIDDNLPECWPPEGIKAFKKITVQFILQVMSSEEIEEFKSCPIDEETIGNGKNNEIVVGNGQATTERGRFEKLDSNFIPYGGNKPGL